MNKYLEKVAARRASQETVNPDKAALAGAVGGLAGTLAGDALGHSMANRAIKRGATTIARGNAFAKGLSGAGFVAGGLTGLIASAKHQEKQIAKRKLEKIAVTLDVDAAGKVKQIHENGSDVDKAFNNAKKILNGKERNIRRAGKIAGAAAVGYGVKHLYDKHMKKQAMTADTKKEALQTGTIGAIGLGTAALSTLAGKAMRATHSVGKMALMGGTLGLIGDYGAVKLNKQIEKKANK